MRSITDPALWLPLLGILILAALAPAALAPGLRAQLGQPPPTRGVRHACYAIGLGAAIVWMVCYLVR